MPDGSGLEPQFIPVRRPTPEQPQMLYLTTFGSSVWYGPARGAPGADDPLVGGVLLGSRGSKLQRRSRD